MFSQTSSTWWQVLRNVCQVCSSFTLQWRHNDRDGVSNHQPHDCLLNCLFRRKSKKTSKLRVTCLCERISPLIGEFPAQRASYAENVSLLWRHHENVARRSGGIPFSAITDCGYASCADARFTKNTGAVLLIHRNTNSMQTSSGIIILMNYELQCFDPIIFKVWWPETV